MELDTPQTKPTYNYAKKIEKQKKKKRKSYTKNQNSK